MTAEFLKWAGDNVGAVVVTIAFLVALLKLVKMAREYLETRDAQAANREERMTQSMEERDRIFREVMAENHKYLQSRDAQSKDIAKSGHEALHGNTRELANLTVEVAKLAAQSNGR